MKPHIMKIRRESNGFYSCLWTYYNPVPQWFGDPCIPRSGTCGGRTVGAAVDAALFAVRLHLGIPEKKKGGKR